MGNLRHTFSGQAPRETSTAAFLDASLTLIGADTRRGMTAGTQEAFAKVAACSDGSARRAGYLENYQRAAGGQAPQARQTNSLKM